MKLETDDKRPVKNPNLDEVTRALTGMKEYGFVILGQDDYHYIQTTPGAIEYRDGDVQFRHEPATYNLPTVQALFESYLRGDGAWQTQVAWQDVTGEVNPTDGGPIKLPIILASVLALLVIVMVIVVVWLKR